MRRIAWGVSILAVLLGVGHMSLFAAAVIGGRWSLDALWFAGTGLAIIFGGLLNVAALRANGDRVALGAAIAGDISLVGFFAAAWSVLQGPQIVAGGLLFTALTLILMAVTVAVTPKVS